jgi:hypothetical protein
MKRIPINSTDSPHFIGCWNIENDDLCSEVIKFFDENHDLQNVGRRVSGKINKEAKDTIDISIQPKDLVQNKYGIINEYLEALNKCYEDYINQWPFLGKFLTSVDIGSFNIQKYNEGGHIAQVHSERTSISTLQRILVFLTYLNDVDEGGHTSFDHYNMDITPKKGNTIIWPAEWTHAHSGKVVSKGQKYIITGWMNFSTNDKD